MSSRKAAFTSFEKDYLKEILIPHINVLQSKRTDADFKKKKSELWIKVADTYNSSPLVQHATSLQLKKLWLNMKSRARDAKSLEKQRSHTGGEPYDGLMDGIDGLKAKLIEEDIEQRKIKFEKQMLRLDEEMKNEKKTFDLKYKMLLLEYEHKKAMYEIELKKAQQ